MEDKQELTIEKYGLRVKSRYRSRGALILDTSDGLYLMREYEKISSHFSFENEIKKQLFQRKMILTDRVLPNCDGEMITEWETGDKYVVYHWYSGGACDYQRVTDLELAAKNLGVLHRNLKDFSEERQPNAVIDADDKETMVEKYGRYNRELKRVYQYMKQKKRKNQFEMQALSCFHEFYEKAERAKEELAKSDFVKQCGGGNRDVCHGAYNYHNLIFTRDGVATTNFENASYGIQLMDLAYFLRKVQEKTGWQVDRGRAVLTGYSAEMPIEPDQMEFLCQILSYPVKYRKLMNQYMNGKKSWISDKNMEKLMAVKKMESAKEKFLRNMATI